MGMDKELKLDDWRRSVLGKVIFARNLLNELRPHEAQLLKLPNTAENREILLTFNTRIESYTMMIVNNLSELTGSGAKNKISFYNDTVKKQDKRWREFFSNHRQNIYNLRELRNNLYAHMNVNFAEKLEPYEPEFYQFIDEAINVMFAMLSETLV